MFGGKFGSRSLEKSFHVEGRPVARPVHRPNFDAAEGNRSRISAMSRIRATVSTLKRERVLKMKLPTEIRALFSLKGSVAFLPMNSIRQALIFSGGEGAQFDGIAFLAARERFCCRQRGELTCQAR